MSKKVVPFRLSRAQAQKLIREAANEFSCVTFIHRPPHGPWKRRVTQLEMQRCLERGEVVTDPKLDKHEYWICMMERVSVRQLVGISVAIKLNEGVASLIVDRT